MNFLDLMQDKPYDDENNNCWHFVQRYYKTYKGYQLPDSPIFADRAEFKGKIAPNIKHIEHTLENCQKGFIVHTSCLGREHAGIAINAKQYIHKTRKGVQVMEIPKKSKIYEIII